MKYPQLAVLGTVVGIYILFTEFMLPGNYVLLPKISLIITSFPEVYNLYPFRSAFLDTFISVFVSMISTYFIFKILGIFIVYLHSTIPAIRYLNVLYKYTPAVLFMAIAVLFYDYNYLAEICMLIIILSFRFGGQIFNSLDNISQEQLDSYRTMPEPSIRVLRKVLWRYSLIEIKRNLADSYRLLWSFAIIYELLGKSVGLGNLIQLLIDYKDYYGLLSVLIFVSIFIYLGMKFINLLVYETTFWER